MTHAQQPAHKDLRGVAVLLDTNHLDQTGMLRDPLTVAMLFYVHQLDGRLVLPGIVKAEWSAHWREHMRKQYKQFRTSRDWLDVHLDGVPDFRADTDPAADKALADRLDELGDLLVEDPIHADDWQAAGAMVIDKRPPTREGNQQYKDSLLWRSLLRVGKERHVVLVSADKGFLGPGEGGLDPALAQEATEQGADIAVVTTRKELLEQLKAQSSAFSVNLEDVWLPLEDPFTEAADDVLREQGMELATTSAWSTEVYATGDPKRIVFAVRFEGQASPTEEPDVDMPWYIDASGSALVDVDSFDFDVTLDSVLFHVSTPHTDVERQLLGTGAATRRPILSRLDIASVQL